MWRAIFILCLLGTPAQACLTAGSGAKCATAAESRFGIGAGALSSGGAKFQKAPERVYPVQIGDTLPDTYYILMNTRRYGLPPPKDGWMYFRVEREVYRVDSRTREVLERVTDQANRAVN
ncbi:MAG: hypothetical protein GKR99_06540 [Rhodobacteraceae bacterium]|nr:hypothetical protein [Paracoccaceae bacterium]